MYEKTSDVLHKEMLDEMDAGYQKTIGFPTHDILKAVAVVFAPFTKNLDGIAAKLDVNNLTGAELRRFVEQRSYVRFRDASYAKAELLITGTGTVHAGDLFATEGGVQFSADDVTVIDTSGFITVTAVIPGPTGNVVAGSISSMPKTLQGITSCTNPKAASGGYAAESDDALRERYLEAKAAPPTSGNVYHYKMWAKEITGVGDARPIPLWNGDNTVKVVIINDRKQPADEALVQIVQEYIDPDSSGRGEGEAPIGAYCTVVSAEPVAINVSVKLLLDSEHTSVDVEPYIAEYLQRIAFKQNYVSVGRISSAILDTPGVLDYENLLVNGGVSNILIADTQVAVLGTVTLNE